jgi:pimeloyl-ACP methyl ester carboxylesterase
VATVVRAVALVCASAIVLACASTPQVPAPTPTSDVAQLPTSAPSHATFAASACPDDVTSQVVVPVTCGFLTVPEDRGKPDGGTVQVFVVRFDPPGGTTTADPVIVLGHLATQDGYGDMASAGQRTHRVEYLIDPRGIGHSTPSLDCPEVALVASPAAGLRLRDAARTTLLTTAIAACHDRLVGQGINLSAYGLAAQAADIDDLRTAFGLGNWNLMTNGDASRLAFEVSRRYPDGLRSLMIDSPSLPSPDFVTVGPEALDSAISALATLCAAQPDCLRAYPDVSAMIRAAVTKLDATPLTLDVSGTVDAIRLGHPIHVVVDGAALLRLIRARLGGSGGTEDGQVLATVRDVIDGKFDATNPGAVSLSSDIGDCLGMLPSCERPNLGALYSIVCADIAPAVDQTRLGASVSDRPAYADVFAPNPLLKACDAWNVAAEPAPPGSGSVTGGVPTLVMRGVLDPFSAAIGDVSAATGSGPNTYLVEVPNQSYNVLGYTECPRAIRNDWIDDPTARPDSACLTSIAPPDLAPASP